MALMIEQKKTGRLLVGIELDDRSAQVSYLRSDQSEAETLSEVQGSEVYDVPLSLARRVTDGAWIFGREAERAVAERKAESAGDLMSLAREGRAATIGGERYQGTALLALYVKKLLSFLVMEVAGAGEGLQIIDALRFTTDEPDETAGKVLQALRSHLKESMPGARSIDWITHAESLHHYLADQPEEIRIHEVLAFWCKNGKLISYRHVLNHHTRPFVASVVRGEEKALSAEDAQTRDEEFLTLVTERISGHIVSSVFLLGDGFDESWLSKSLEYICRGRKAYLGNNLFSKGAVISLREQSSPDQGAQTVFLGPDKLMANVGIRLKKQGESHYHALLDAGTSWYDARASLDLILDKDERIALEITPLSAGAKRSEILELDGLGHVAARERRATRLAVELTMFSVDRVRLSVLDLGFGDFFPSTGEHWERFISLGEGGDAQSGVLADGLVSEPILCTGKLAEKPYGFPFLEARIFSAEELCYLIAHNDYLLTMDSFSESLCDWLEKECMLRPLADELRELLRKKCSLSAFAGTVLEYIRLYPPEEISRIEEVVRSGDTRDGVEKKFRIIEYLIRENRLTEAVNRLQAFDRREQPPVVLARLYYDEGVVYAKLFHYAAAASCMEKAFSLSGDREVKEAYLSALRLSMSEEEYIRIIGDRPELSPESLTLETRMSEMSDLFAAGPENHLVNTLGVYLDTGKLSAFDEEAAGAEEEARACMRRMLG
ncbi:MAG: hypothetical protein K5696_07280 [Lachnospiraceae bacterium]|nr:hypothetical protein [Lachnospiraceae bacterium]